MFFYFQSSMIVTASTVALKYNTLECNSAKDTRTLVAFLANADPAAVQYAQATQAAFAARGLGFVLVHCTRTQLETRILEANTDPHVAGIMVYYPVFATGQDQYLQNIVAPHKDVEGLCHTFRFNLYNNVRFMGAMKCIVPCTPLVSTTNKGYCQGARAYRRVQL